MTKVKNKILIRSLLFIPLIIGLASSGFQVASAVPHSASEAWNQDQELLRRVLQNRKKTQNQSRTMSFLPERGILNKDSLSKKRSASLDQFKRLEFEYSEALEQKDVTRLNEVRSSLSELFPKYRLPADKRWLEAQLRYEQRQLGACLDLLREILRDSEAKSFYPRALLLRAQAFRDLGLETAALGTYELLIKKFPRSPQAELGEMEAKVMRMSLNR
jgi:hypothetical protein